MKELGILMKQPLADQVEKGRKDVTRRLVPEHLQKYDRITWNSPRGEFYFQSKFGSFSPSGSQFAKSKYQVGDHLYRKEPFKIVDIGGDMTDNYRWTIKYKDGCKNEIYGPLFKDEKTNIKWFSKVYDALVLDQKLPFNSSLSCPRNAARLWMEITDVRAELLQDITDEECIREGIEVVATDDHNHVLYKNYNKAINFIPCFLNPKASFKSLWNSIHPDPKHQWDANPWDWRYGIKQIEKHN